jgi:hypothetical protein
VRERQRYGEEYYFIRKAVLTCPRRYAKAMKKAMASKRQRVPM